MNRETIEDYKEFAVKNENLSTKELVMLMNNEFDATFYIHKGGIYVDMSDKGCKNLLVYQKKMLIDCGD